jgi:hypothetical protein
MIPGEAVDIRIFRSFSCLQTAAAGRRPAAPQAITNGQQSQFREKRMGQERRREPGTG